MKKVSMVLVHLDFKMVIVLFLIVTLISCNATGNIALNGKGLIIDNLRILKMPTKIRAKLDTNKVVEGMDDTTANKELTGDYRYDNMFK
jgi:hypothetical protein